MLRREGTDLGSVICIDCRTRPQYVFRSNWDSGSSRSPGNEEDMVPRVFLDEDYLSCCPSLA